MQTKSWRIEKGGIIFSTRYFRFFFSHLFCRFHGIFLFLISQHDNNISSVRRKALHQQNIKVEDQQMSHERTTTNSKNKKLNAHRNTIAFGLTSGLMTGDAFLLYTLHSEGSEPTSEINCFHFAGNSFFSKSQNPLDWMVDKRNAACNRATVEIIQIWLFRVRVRGVVHLLMYVNCQ